MSATTPLSSSICPTSTSWTPLVQSKLSFEDHSPIAHGSGDHEIISPLGGVGHITASTSDQYIRTALSSTRAELHNATQQVEQLRSFILSPDVPDDVKDWRQWRLTQISLEAQRDSQAHQLSQCHQQLEQLQILYKGTCRELANLRQLHDQQHQRDISHQSSRDQQISQLTERIGQLRDALHRVNSTLTNERQSHQQCQQRLKTAEDQIQQLNDQIGSLDTDLVHHREQIDTLLGQLSELSSRSGGGQVLISQQLTTSDVIANNNNEKPLRSSTPTHPEPIMNPNGQSSTPREESVPESVRDRVISCRDVAISCQIEEQSHINSLRQRITSLEDELLSCRDREKQTDHLCDLLQAELENHKRSNQTTGDRLCNHNDSSSQLIDLCMEECTKLKESNTLLIASHDRLMKQLKAQTEDNHRLRQQYAKGSNPLSSHMNESSIITSTDTIQ